MYHYFQVRTVAASTELITQKHSLYGKDNDDSVPASKGDALTALLTTLDDRFQGEMVLLFDYIKNRYPEGVAKDELLKKADSRFMDELSSVVVKAQLKQAYALMMGGLLASVI